MIVFDITLTFTGPPRSLRRQRKKWTAIKKETYLGAARFWHRRLKKKHFTKAGAREYNYTPRKGGEGSGHVSHGTYTHRKRRKFGHTLPLVWSGQLRAESKQEVVRGTSKGSRAIIRGRVLNLRLRNSRIDMRKEMTTVSTGDAKRVVEDAHKRANRLVNKTKSARAVIKV